MEPKQILIKQLCEFFRLDPEFITPIEEIEMHYIFSRLARRLATTEQSIVFPEIKRIGDQFKCRSKRQRLYRVFYYVQSVEMTESGRYDTNTLAPPQPRSWHSNYY